MASVGIVVKGMFRVNDVAIKMNAVGSNEVSMVELFEMPKTFVEFRINQNVSPHGACVIPNHIMMVTEFAPCGSLADAIKKRDEPDDQGQADA